MQSWIQWIHICSNEGPHPFPRGMTVQISISTKHRRRHFCVKGIRVFSSKVLLTKHYLEGKLFFHTLKERNSSITNRRKILCAMFVYVCQVVLVEIVNVGNVFYYLSLLKKGWTLHVN